MSRMHQLPTGVSDLDSYVIEAQDYLNQGLLTSGHREQLDTVARLKKFQFTSSGEVLSTRLI